MCLSVMGKGTADAVRQYLWLLEEQQVMEFLILAGDHLYRMDYQKFIQVHRESNADITVAALPMDEKRATAFGLMKIDSEGRIVEFAEKPKGELLKAMKVCSVIQKFDLVYDLLEFRFTKTIRCNMLYMVLLGLEFGNPHSYQYFKTSNYVCYSYA